MIRSLLKLSLRINSFLRQVIGCFVYFVVGTFAAAGIEMLFAVRAVPGVVQAKAVWRIGAVEAHGSRQQG